MKSLVNKLFGTFFVVLSTSIAAYAQGDAKVDVKMDASQILVGDQARYFIEAQHNASQSKLQWATIPDTFNNLEIVEKGKIDTIKQGDLVTYKQRLLITGFDSGMHVIPSFVFPVIPNSGTAYTIQTDSLPLLVQTVAVDTTQPFKGIKEIMPVKTSWLDYIWYILGALLFLLLITVVIIYFVRNKKVAAPVTTPPPPQETLQEKALRMLAELERKHLWQGNQVKQYYVELTDILRGYIEARFNTPTMELTTDELLQSVRLNRELNKHAELLSAILYTADLAKFAKAQPLPHEHANAMELAIKFVNETKPAETPKQS
ncbi:hypothetical protein [Polluticoccus soli]|uniref:hypothetical protein n=1 Tax=Polluticoccus soli TaxID=3034150 RepID=UPI0023E2E82D|nr:hypothetical protein [Flavipsychrobacter sp. JY13-12]